MKKQILLWIALGGLLPVSGIAAECGPEAWFDLEAVDIQCPLADSKVMRLSLPFAESYIAPEPPEEGEADPGLDRLEALQSKQDKISLTLQPLASDLKPENPSEFRIARGGIDASFTTNRGIGSFRLTFPAGTLLCDGEPVTDETVVEIPPPGDDPLVNCTSENEASRPPDWRIDVAPADDDAEDDPGVAVEFEIEKDWGYNFELNRDQQRWSTNLWRLQIAGSGVTNDADFYDSVKADFSWSYTRSYVLAAARKRPFPEFWGSAYFRPETTFSDDKRDYVYGARLEVIANLRKLIGTDVGVGTRPYLSLGIEQVDPAKREDGTVPDNYGRLTGDFLWKFSPLERVRVEADWTAKYILSKDDLLPLGLDDQLQDKLEISIAYDATGAGEFLPFLKYTRGTESPGFEVVKEILFGFAWNHLFAGEQP
ncbi:MAG TPA: hypothetical protein VGX68_15195 [Thermoanaerobaculia bacterium]|jgi:hypothetical protein|nr:hypothetical protein [Thermoanaerobaculia bacterium]